MRLFKQGFLFILGMFLFACARQEGPMVDLAAEENAIRELSAQWVEYANAGDAAGLASLFDSEGTIIRDGMDPVVGPEDIEWYMDVGVPDYVLDVTTNRLLMGSSGDVGVEFGSWTVTYEDGESYEGNHVTVYHKVDGKWMITGDISVSSTEEE